MTSLVELPDLFSTNEIELEDSAESYAILNYNQRLVEFADGKAGNLILINSLFIAAAQAMPSTGIIKLFQAGFICCSAFAVIICLSIIMSRKGGPISSRPHPPDLVFFADIMQRKSPEEYVDAFDLTSEAERRSSALRRAYVVAGIAARKFKTFRPAQTLTAMSAGIWVVANLIGVLVG